MAPSNGRDGLTALQKWSRFRIEKMTISWVKERNRYRLVSLTDGALPRNVTKKASSTNAVRVPSTMEMESNARALYLAGRSRSDASTESVEIATNGRSVSKLMSRTCRGSRGKAAATK